MLPMLIKSGIVGMLIGISAQANDVGRNPGNSNPGRQVKKEDCLQAVPPAGDSIYKLRSLGRAEARQTGRKFSVRGMEENIYSLRSLGRSEARQTGKKLPGGMEAADSERAHDIYGLRYLGRGEAHWTGLEICEGANHEVTMNHR